MKTINEGLTFDDVLIVPDYCDFLPEQADASVTLAPGITLNAPLLSAGMSTVTESKMAIAMARSGGMGIIHSHMTVQAQADEVDRVKRSEHGVISDPFCLSPNHYVYEADRWMAKYQISGVPVTEHGKLVGIVTNRDIRFENDPQKKIYEVMTKDNLITAPVGTTLEEAKNILTMHKVEKLPIVDEKGNFHGLITIKDINKSIQFPLSAKDKQGRLLAGASVSTTPDVLERVDALVKAQLDLLVLEVQHGHTKQAIEAVQAIKAAFPDLPLAAGNVATAEATLALIKAGANLVKVGIGSSSVSTMRVVAGVGVPQISALLQCAEAARPHNVPIIADGGIRYSGDVTKALAAGASACMLGNLLAGCDEAPGGTEVFQGRKYKIYKSTYSVAQPGETTPEGVEGRAAYKGAVGEEVSQLVGGLCTGMAYAGCRTVAELHQRAQFIRVSGAGLKESHPHNIQVTKESSNYSMR